MRNTFYLLLYKELPHTYNSAPEYVFDVTGQVTFGTQLHGGFMNASTNIFADRLTIKFYFDQLLGYHGIIIDTFNRTAFEGRVVNLSSIEFTLTIQLVGYYADAATVVDDRIYVSSPVYVMDIVTDSVDLIDSWRNRQSTYAFALYDLIVSDPDTGDDLPLDFTDMKVQAALERCLSYGSSPVDTRPPYFAIWEGRYAVLMAKPDLQTSIPNWVIGRENVQSSPPQYNINVDGVFNSIYAIYANVGAGSSKTTAAIDTNSITRYGLREGVVQNGGNPEGLAMGEDLRDYALEQFAWPVVSSSITVEGYVYTWAGSMHNNHVIRAGDVIYVDTGDPNAIVFPSTSPEVGAKTKMFVIATNYVASSNTITLTIGDIDKDFAVLMSRLGLSGGLR